METSPIITNPHPHVVQKITDAQVKTYSKYASLPECVRDFASHLLMEDHENQGDIGNDDAAVASTLFRKSIVLTDGVASLLSIGSAEQAEVLVRALCESCIKVAFMCKSKNTLNMKANAYRYAHLKQQLKYADILFSQDGFDKSLEYSGRVEKLVSDQVRIKESLERSEYQAFRDYDKHKKKKSDPDWYEYCPNEKGKRASDLCSLHREVEMEKFYGIYRMYSNSTHSSDALSGIKIANDKPIIAPIRFPKNIPNIASLSALYMMLSVKRYTLLFHPSRDYQLTRFYALRVQKRKDEFLNSEIEIEWNEQDI